jgi:protein ImuB
MAVLVGTEPEVATAAAQAARGFEGRRVMVVWCPDWPVVAAALQHELSLDAPLAVVEKGEVFACSAAARLEGVKRGMRRRDASARCPELLVVDRAPETETRSFEAVLSAVEEVSAGVAPV